MYGIREGLVVNDKTYFRLTFLGYSFLMKNFKKWLCGVVNFLSPLADWFQTLMIRNKFF